MKEMTKLMDRFMQIISKEESNIPAALFIDQFFKTIVIKLDKTLQIIERENNLIKKECKAKVKESVEKSKEEILINNKKLAIEKKLMESQKEQTISLIAS